MTGAALLDHYLDTRRAEGHDAATAFSNGLDPANNLALYREAQVRTVRSQVEAYMAGVMTLVDLDLFVDSAEESNRGFLRDALFISFCDIYVAHEWRTPEHNAAFLPMLHFGPKAVSDVCHQHAVDLGLLPARADGYTEDGRPLYRLDDIAERTGVEVDDIPQRFLGGAYTGEVSHAH